MEHSVKYYMALDLLVELVVAVVVQIFGSRRSMDCRNWTWRWWYW
jgi:hypothetical protein